MTDEDIVGHRFDHLSHFFSFAICYLSQSATKAQSINLCSFCNFSLQFYLRKLYVEYVAADSMHVTGILMSSPADVQPAEKLCCTALLVSYFFNCGLNKSSCLQIVIVIFMYAIVHENSQIWSCGVCARIPRG